METRNAAPIDFGESRTVDVGGWRDSATLEGGNECRQVHDRTWQRRRVDGGRRGAIQDLSGRDVDHPPGNRARGRLSGLNRDGPSIETTQSEIVKRQNRPAYHAASVRKARVPAHIRSRLVRS